MTDYFNDECDYLYAVDNHVRRLRAAVAAHPDPRDPDYDEEAVERLNRLEDED